MKIFKHHYTQIIPSDMQTVWEFFSSPENLNRITPPEMSFKILDDLNGQKIYPGMFIKYLIRPMLNIPMRWVTEITQVAEGSYFVDEQRVGPYRIWHHEHHFAEQENGILMTDIIHYAIPLGPLGLIANAMFVDKQVRKIFDYRQTIIGDIF